MTTRQVEITAEPRLLARYDADAGAWAIDAGTYRIALSHSAMHEAADTEVELSASSFGR